MHDTEKESNQRALFLCFIKEEVDGQESNIIINFILFGL